MPSGLPAIGVATLSHFSMLHFGGADTQAFLHGQLSCDVNSLAPGQACYGSYNTPKGRMLASFLLWRDETGYLMQLPRNVCDTTCKRLSMYVLRSKVECRDVSDDFQLMGIAGTGATALLARLCGSMPSTSLALTSVDGAQLLRLDDTRFEFIADREHAGALHDALRTHAASISAAAWDWTNIRAGIPYITPATQDQFVPQMANLDLLNGVSFTKGCYPGQEIVARMHYLGKLKQRMYLAVINGSMIPQPGDKLYSPGTGEQATGMVVNAAPDPGGGYAALAVMHIASHEGGDVRLKSPAGPRLKFVDLPYSIPS